MPGGSRMNTSFRIDPNIDEIAKAYALDAIDIALRNFGITLDWSDKSIQLVEDMLEQLHDSLADTKPPEDTVWVFAKSFGSYLGEVFCKNHGGTWGMVRLENDEI